MNGCRYRQLLLLVGGLTFMGLGGAWAAERHTVWDLEIGTEASALPEDFVDFACGTNGGPPGRVLTAFTDYAACPAAPGGLHEVYFRYNDELEYIARALDMAEDIERFRGTRVEGFDSVVSALFDDAGVLRGIRIASDPRGVEPGVRNDQWRLGALLMRRFGEENWSCDDAPLSDRELPVTSFFVKRQCSKVTKDLTLSVEQNYFHRRGESFTDEYGTVQPTNFISTSLFELLAAPP
ncbi:MAG TPA: hypothetical protein VGM83_14335 [Devosiaceae bacterium]|jgi:hypothetical protein